MSVRAYPDFSGDRGCSLFFLLFSSVDVVAEPLISRQFAPPAFRLEGCVLRVAGHAVVPSDASPVWLRTVAVTTLTFPDLAAWSTVGVDGLVAAAGHFPAFRLANFRRWFASCEHGIPRLVYTRYA